MRLISFAVLSAALICSMPAAAKTQNEQEQQTVGNPQDKKVCRKLKMSGTRMADRVCLTKEQWKQVDAMK